MTKNNEEQKAYLEFQILSQQINQLQHQINSINTSVMELKSLETTLDEIKKVKKDNNLLIPLGNNIFIKGKLENNNELIMGVGSKTLVKKELSEAKELIEDQIKELEKINLELETEVSNASIQLEKLQEELIKNK